jgi:hypothetical protein
MMRNFGFEPNGRQAGPDEIKKFRNVQTSVLGVFYQGIKHGRVMKLSGVEVRNE